MNTFGMGLRAVLATAAMAALTGLAPAQGEKPAEQAVAPKTPIGEIYSLPNCPTCDERLAPLGTSVAHMVDGRELRFSNEQCFARFEADKARYLAKINQQVIAQQGPSYPLDRCAVTPDEPLAPQGEYTGIDLVHNNRLARLCCNDCADEFKADPAKYFATIDTAIIAAQSKDYPLTTCPVSSEVLGGMGEPKNVVVGGRLVRLCCSGCRDDLRADPARYIEKIDEARAEAKKTE